MDDTEDKVWELFAQRELMRIDGGIHLTGEPQALPIERIIENYYGISIEYHCLRKTLKVLGQMVFEGGHVPIYDRENGRYTLIDVPPNTMLIDIRLIENRRYENRLRFTYAHELSHYLKDRAYFTNSDLVPAQIMANGAVKENDDIERRANRMASYLLLPAGQLKKAYYRMNGFNDPKIDVKLARLFGVSRKAVRIRLGEYDLPIGGR